MSICVSIDTYIYKSNVVMVQTTSVIPETCQMIVICLLALTCHGISPLVASFPPTMRSSMDVSALIVGRVG